MATIDVLKEQEAAQTPLLLFDCTLSSGTVERWSTHAVLFGDHTYAARLVRHNVFSVDEARVSITLANADSHFSEIEREVGFRGALVTVQLVFFDLVSGAAASEARMLFRGIGNSADEITESGLRVTFTNRLNLQRIVLPDVRIQRRCPWLFPSSAAQRAEAVDGGVKGTYSALYKCGYSPDQTGGVGSLNSGAPFSACDYTRASCTDRGMFTIGRFGGIEFVPPQIQVRGYGESGSHLSAIAENEAVYNDFVPLVYGTVWHQPPIVFARNDGNLTHLEVLLGMGEIQGVLTVVVNGIEIPEGVNGVNMTATGWFNMITPGTRSGAFNTDFEDGSGNPLGDPYGSMAMMSVVVPNRINDGQSLPSIKVLLNGMKLQRFNDGGEALGASFTNNPAWVLLDVIRRSGWLLSEVDVASFAETAANAAELIETTDLYGNTVLAPRFQCNLVVRTRKSASEIAKGIRNGSSLLLTYGTTGLLTLKVENTLALQQAVKPEGSNAAEELNGGWPAYEFSDGSAEFSGILRKPNGEPTVRLYSPNAPATVNRLTVEFQDEFNEYQQDSLSLVDVDDALLTGREVTAAAPALGIPNFDQATRMLELGLAKSVQGNTFLEFETTAKGVGLKPGDLIAFTYLKEGLERQPFRIVEIAPTTNLQTMRITAQWHDDDWYTSGGANSAGGRRRGAPETGLPRPLVGSLLDSNGIEQFGIAETLVPLADGGSSVKLSVSFLPPDVPMPGGANIPLVSLNPGFATTGGTIKGGQTLYYAASATDSSGAESDLSFAVRAKIPAGTDTNAVTLSGLSFSGGTAGFDVYRGENPLEFLRIAENVAVATSFTDTGLTQVLAGPPDANFDHANFYWRLELQPEEATEIHSATTIGRSALGMATDEFKGALVRITRGTGATQERLVTGNSATTLTVTPPWRVPPDASSFFVVADGTWNLAAVASTSPVEFEVPNRPGATVEVSGRSANAQDQESAYELNPLTRWTIGGGGGSVDMDTPPVPTFTLSAGGQGTVALSGIGFSTLSNTNTILAGTLSVFWWDELSSPTAFALAADIVATDTTIGLSAAGSVGVGDFVQIDEEILEVQAVLSGGTEYQVVRGSHHSTAAGHSAGALIYHLTRDTTIVPFAKGFFGSPAAAAYSYSVFLPDARIGAAELFMTNSVGGGVPALASYGAFTDLGLRTLAGGQLSMQVQGYLAVQTGAAPALVIEDSHAARDISAVVAEAPVGGSLVVQLRLGSSVYCTLTIAAGEMVSNTVDGFGIGSLAAGALLNLDITGLPTGAGSLPGRDLTVTVRR